MTSSPLAATAAPLSLLRFYYEEEDLSDEIQALLSSLPRERNWVGKNMYLYEGSWFHPRIIQGLVACQKHFQARDSDTILVTYPKCGTTWLMAMAFALTSRSTLTLALDHDHPLLTTNPHDLVPSLEMKLYSETNKLPDLSTLTSYSPRRLFAAHLPIGSLPRAVVKDNPSCKVVYMCRNPKDTFVSMWHFFMRLLPKDVPRTSNMLRDMFDEFCDGKSPYGPFWDHVLGAWKESSESPRKVLFLKYEDFKEQPAGQLRRLAEFLDCPFSPEEESRGAVDQILKLCSFDQLSNLEVNKTGESSLGRPNSAFFRKGRVGDWKTILTPEMSDKMDRITELKMRGSDLKF